MARTMQSDRQTVHATVVVRRMFHIRQKYLPDGVVGWQSGYPVANTERSQLIDNIIERKSRIPY